MKDINKIKLIHGIKTSFRIDDNTLKKFTEQIESSDFKENIERFFRGYTVEDAFHVLFSSMPWVKLIHELGQNQLPNLSKEIYQVPDFTIFFETGKRDYKPVLLEVKSVKGDSQSLEVMTKQMNACVAYSNILGIPFLYAIYWQKYKTWTFNAVENFDSKSKKHRINFFEAFKNDLSVIVGDITFIIDQPVYRKTVFDHNNIDSVKAKHGKFGTILSDNISKDNLNFIKIESIESAIIDSNIKMKIIDTKKDGDKTTITEISDGNYFLKLSTVTLRHLAIFGVELNEQYADVSRRIIIEFFKKLDITRSYAIPNSKTPTSDILYNQAFEVNWVLSNYSNT